jgi:hypothetical protein
MVTTSPLHHLPIGARREVETLIEWMTAPPIKVGIFDDQYTTDSDRSPHPA